MEDKKITAEELLEALDLDLKDMAQKVADAINNATPGRGYRRVGRTRPRRQRSL